MRTIDFRRTGWGHNYYLHIRNDDGSWRATLITTPRPEPGDEVLLESATGGTLHYEVTGDIRTPMDPGDMHHVTLTFKEKTTP
jgi:hypothetical protein